MTIPNPPTQTLRAYPPALTVTARNARHLCSWLTTQGGEAPLTEAADSGFDEAAIDRAEADNLIRRIADNLLAAICEMEDRRPHLPKDGCHCFCSPPSMGTPHCGHMVREALPLVDDCEATNGAAPLTKQGKVRDSQKTRVYRFETDDQTMAGGDPNATTILWQWGKTSDLDDELVNGALERIVRGGAEWVRVPRVDRAGREMRRYRRSTVLPLHECVGIAERVCAAYGLPPIPLTDGRGRKSAALRWRHRSAAPTGAPRMTHANGHLYSVSIALPVWARHVWSLLHELAHYITYAYFPPSTPAHGGEFVGVLFDLLEDHLPGWDRGAAERGAKRRRVKVAAGTRAMIAGHRREGRQVNAAAPIR